MSLDPASLDRLSLAPARGGTTAPAETPAQASAATPAGAAGTPVRTRTADAAPEGAQDAAAQDGGPTDGAQDGAQDAAAHGGPRRVLHVAEAPLGGVISCLEELLRGQTARDVDGIEVITPEINRAALAGAAHPRLRLTCFPHDRGSVAGLLRLARLTVTRARATRPEVLHVHSTIAGAVVRLCRPLLPRGTRIVYCPHGWAFVREGAAWKNRAIGLVERALSGLSDRILCVSASEKRDAEAVGIAAARLVVVENGISPRPFAAPTTPASATQDAFPSAPTPTARDTFPSAPAPAARDTFSSAPTPAARDGATRPKVVAFVGRFDRQKGFDTYLETMRLLGDGARGLAIGRAIVSAGPAAPVPPNVEILGWQPRERVYALYQEADLLLMPSRWEGFPLVALEAMEAGLAVFATRVGGLPDIVVEGETGRLFDPDDAAGMAAALRGTSIAALREQGARGRARYLARHTAARMNAGVWDLYRSLAPTPA